jgi:acyl-coenzyme A synthetase/AMP-(fatty) acid ligase
MFVNGQAPAPADAALADHNARLIANGYEPIAVIGKAAVGKGGQRGIRFESGLPEAQFKRAADAFTPRATGIDDPALVIYTSGTTGKPKGALHSHRVLLGHLPGMQLAHDFFPAPGECYWTQSARVDTSSSMPSRAQLSLCRLNGWGSPNLA